jgi:hypothetical protein
MNFNNSQPANQIRNLTTIINSTLSLKQFPSINEQLTLVPFFIRYQFIFLIILFILLSLILFVILKCTREKDTHIQRPQPAIRRRFEPKPGAPDDPHITLLDRTINNSRIISTEPILEQTLTEILPDTPRDSSISISSQHSSITNDNDGFSDLNLNNIAFHRIQPLNNNLPDRIPPEIPENPYIVEFERQEKEKINARKRRINTAVRTASSGLQHVELDPTPNNLYPIPESPRPVSYDSTSSEESCL